MFLIVQKSPEHVSGLFLKKFKKFFQKVSKQSCKLVIYIEAIIGKDFQKNENAFQKIERGRSTLMRYDPEKVCERILKQIRRYSEREGLTMSSLAREAGLSASTISEMMCGKTRPQVYTLMKICNVLDVHGCSDGRIHGRWGSARKAGPPTAGSESLQCFAGVEAEKSAGVHRDDRGL